MASLRHRLLLRQVRKHFGPAAEFSPEWTRFLSAVESAYEQFDTDRRLVERAMAISSDELLAANEQLRRQNQQHRDVLMRLRALARSLDPDIGESDADLLKLSRVIEDLVQKRREVERALRAARDGAEAANRAKSEFLANMSHEIRTPMNAIIGMASLLREPGSTPEEQRECAETILGAGDSLLRIINDILDFSKIEAGQMDFERAIFDPRVCVWEAVDLVTTRYSDKKGVEVKVEAAENIPGEVIGDPTRLRQILVNLIDNAVKFTEAGRVVVSIDAQGEPAGGQLNFAVSDTGIGIPPDGIDRLFKSFSQVDTSITRRFGGSGLGLAICRRLIELMDGTISVESAPGRGSRFSFHIRVAVPGERTIGPSAGRPGGRIDRGFAAEHPLRILIAEDNYSNRRVLLLFLEKLGYDCEAVINGREAMQCLARQRYDLLILDIQMPEMDGITLARNLRRSVPVDTPPYLLALTANARREDRQACLEAGMHDFLSKPVRLPDLTLALERAHRWLASAARG